MSKEIRPYQLKSGIYKLEWSSGYFYYGQTQNFSQRKSSHLSRMKRGTHTNKFMVRLYLKYGNPEFEIIKFCEIENLNIEEQKYLDLSVGNKMCCNNEFAAGSSRGIKRSEETREKIRKIRSGKPLSVEHKRSISEGGRKKYASGYIQPKFYGKDNHFYNKNHTEESKILMKKSKNKGELNSKARIVINLETGIFYGCIRDAAKSRLINPNTLNNMLTGARKNKTSFSYA